MTMDGGAPGRLGGLKVYLAEDQDHERQELTRMLEQLACSVTAFTSNADCLRQVAAHPERLPDCIVADLRMPFVDGVDLILALRQRQLRVPVVTITGLFPEHKLVAEAYKAGASGVLHKPVQPEALEHAVQRAVRLGAGSGR